MLGSFTGSSRTANPGTSMCTTGSAATVAEFSRADEIQTRANDGRRTLQDKSQDDGKCERRLCSDQELTPRQSTSEPEMSPVIFGNFGSGRRIRSKFWLGNMTFRRGRTSRYG